MAAVRATCLEGESRVRSAGPRACYCGHGGAKNPSPRDAPSSLRDVVRNHLQRAELTPCQRMREVKTSAQPRGRARRAGGRARS